ncbi:MAG: hypothetical protein RLZZ69_3292, partial [Cyanobacteriota bacterium]
MRKRSVKFHWDLIIVVLANQLLTRLRELTDVNRH